jgi:hypothetical protein
MYTLQKNKSIKILKNLVITINFEKTINFLI